MKTSRRVAGWMLVSALVASGTSLVGAAEVAPLTKPKSSASKPPLGSQTTPAASTAPGSARPAPTSSAPSIPVVGTPDASFDAKAGFNDTVRSIALAGDKIIVGGSFVTYQGKTRRGVARLLANGALDTTFDPGGGPDGPVRAVAVEPNGKVWIGGNFSNYGGGSTPSVKRRGIARLMPNGTLDASFDAGSGPEGDVDSIHRQADGKLLVGGSFFRFNGLRRQYIVRLNADGTVDPSFDAKLGPEGSGYNPSGQVRAIAIQPDGKIVIAGKFAEHRGSGIRHVMRLKPDGSPDTTFTPVTVDGSVDSHVASVAIQADGKIVFAGRFVGLAGRSRKSLARVQANGVFDNTFVPGTGQTGLIWGDMTAVHAFRDGRILVGGHVSAMPNSGLSLNNAALLFQNGAIAPHFRSSLPFEPTSFAETTDQKLLVVGQLPDAAETPRIARFWAAP